MIWEKKYILYAECAYVHLLAIIHLKLSKVII